MPQHIFCPGFLALLLCLMNSPLAQAVFHGCMPFRDPVACPAKTWAQEYDCLMRQNSLPYLMNCVSTFPGGSDSKLCQDTTDDVPNNGDSRYWSVRPPNGAQCNSARQVLLAGSDYPQCQRCAMRGLIEACPQDDPNFLNCLCEYSVQRIHLECLSFCFGDGSMGDFYCPHWTNRRDEASSHGAVEPLFKRSSESDDFLLRWDEYISINADGRPCFINRDTGGCTLGPYILPHFDLPNAVGNWDYRCFVHPKNAEKRCYALKYDLYERSANVPRDYATFTSEKTIDQPYSRSTRNPAQSGLPYQLEFFETDVESMSISTATPWDVTQGSTRSLIQPTAVTAPQGQTSAVSPTERPSSTGSRRVTGWLVGCLEVPTAVMSGLTTVIMITLL
ncbi:hypothetical protein BGZ61DRAFT_480761 [Ilyonectria robusta]|uniref:uncharacterized protein n=1 Tax=Ilyonectria robusta TaxID=1079257 RepID=UPI001E8E6D6D|nr:uncharacterized protein BGZ61DRAFT_480761 [Ilyonectria robusta]KAH8683734.1 hypothetical protein BGZ61DRAFT_480761 [Ilyonectria robusta]